MKLFSKSMLAAALLAGVSVSAETVTYAKVADFKITNRITSDTEAGFQVKNEKKDYFALIIGKNPVPVAAGKEYKVSCEYRLAPGCTKSDTFLFSLYSLDKDKNHISVSSVLCRPGTLTELAAPAKAGDTVVKVKDASKWKPKYACVAFNAKADNSDMPNYDLSPRIGKIEETGDCWTLTLTKPLKKDYPAGTVVRNHADGRNFVPVERKNLAPTAEWQSVSKTFSGFSDAGESTGEDFRTGTAFIAPVFSGPKGTFGIEFRNVRIEELQ